MLPHAPNIGISETYGTATVGNANFSADDGGSVSLDFLTAHSEIPRRLAVVNSSYRKIWNPITSNSMENIFANVNADETLDEKLIKRNSRWVTNKKPEGIEHNIDYMTQGLGLESQIFDPTLSKVCEIFKINDQVYSVINAGKDGNILVFGRMDPEWNGWKVVKKSEYHSNLQKDSDTFEGLASQGNDESVSTSSNLKNMKSPKFVWLRSLTLKSRILGIETFTINIKSHPAILVLIRTLEKVYLLKCACSKTSLVLSKVFDFKQGPMWASFAHSSVLVSSNSIMLCIVDCIGKFIVFKSNSLVHIDFFQVKLKYESFYDPVELSNFKKSMWIDSRRLILFSRTQLFEYTLDTFLDDTLSQEKFLCRICAGIWSKILDIKPSSQRNSLLYMLTSKEIILVDVSRGFKRKFAWKHYLSDIDTTLYLNLLKTPQNSLNEICIISSKSSVVNYVIEFNTRHFKTVDDPYLFITNLENASVSTDIYQLSERCCLHVVLQKFKNGEASFSMLNYTNSYNDHTKYGRLARRQCEVEKYQVLMKHSSGLPIERCLFSSLYHKLSTYYKFNEKKSTDPTEVTEEIYDVLKSFLDEESVSHKSLFQLMSNIHIPRNVKNIFKIVKHLVGNSDKTDFGFKLIDSCWLTDRATPTDNSEVNIESRGLQIMEFFQFLAGKKYKHIIPDIILYLLLGLIILGKNKGTLNQGNIGEHLKASILKLPDDYQEMLGSFNDDANIAGVMDLENENFASSDANLYKDSMTNVPSISISQAPQISISQSRTYDRFRSGGTLASKKIHMPPVPSSVPTSVSNSQQFSQMSQKSSQLSTGGLSQSQSRGPKRKKRRTGF